MKKITMSLATIGAALVLTLMGCATANNRTIPATQVDTWWEAAPTKPDSTKVHEIAPTHQKPTVNCTSKTDYKSCPKDQIEMLARWGLGVMWNDYFARSFPGMTHPRVVYIPRGLKTQGCKHLFVPTTFTAGDLTFCDGENTLYAGGGFIAELYVAGGGLTSIGWDMGHELTHKVQVFVYGQDGASHIAKQAIYQHELAADCGGGVAIHRAITSGLLPNQPQAPFTALAVFDQYHAIAGTVDPKHLATPQRKQAIQFGLSHDMAACLDVYNTDPGHSAKPYK